MFSGSFTYAVDAKGRISIPARLRKNVAPEANDTFYMTRGTSNCIKVMPLNEWKILENKLGNLNEFNSKHVRMLRMMMMYAHEDVMDSQSRILVPQVLLSYAKIEKEVVVLGMLNRIEFWNPELYDQYINESEQSYEQIAEEVMGL